MNATTAQLDNPTPRSRDWSWLLMGGCPRSGTTLLQLVLNTHPQIRLTNEFSLFRGLANLRSVFAREEEFRNWRERARGARETWRKADLEPFIPRYEKCAGAMFRALYEAQFADRVALDSVRYLGDKLPQYYAHDLDALEALLGPVWILHLSRNPVDVVNSMLRRSRNAQRGKDTWDLVHTVEDGCVHWARAWNALLRFRAARPGRVVHVKYEEILTDCDGCLARMADALHVEPTFDTSAVVVEDPAARDAVSGQDAARVDALLGGIASRWSEPLEVLEKEYEPFAIGEA